MYTPTEKESDKIRVGITHGDFNGIGYEIIMKTMQDARILEMITPVIYGSSKIASYYRKAFDMADINFNLIKKAEYANSKRVNIINCYENEVKIEVGKHSAIAGELAYYALEKAVEDLNRHKIDVVVTAPVSKYSIQSDKFNFSGQTEYFASKYNIKEYLMLMIGTKLRIGTVTGHIPLRDVHKHITTDLILEKIKVMNKTLQMDFGINRPKIAVLGLNPHAGDEGLIGKEEIEIIRPAIQKAFDEKILTFGPYPADGFFGSSNFFTFDGILAMYHDQGMLPFKAISFEEGVNFTAGLPIIRTSPAHGTAFDIAGKNVASPDSFRQAIYTAMDIFCKREMFKNNMKNPLPVKQAPIKQEPETLSTSKPVGETQ
jgi:4-hydroxythreonine-4-phosphate dehydrogenase